MHKRPVPYEETRPWGGFTRFTHNEQTTVKILSVGQDVATSLQSHEHRSEFWIVLEGAFKVTFGNTTKHIRRGDELWVPVGTRHRLRGVGLVNRILEISYGKFDENDIKRFEDDWDRHK